MSRGKRYEKVPFENKKKILYIVGIGALIALIALIFTLSIYKTKQDAESKIAEMEEFNSSDATIVSSTEDKTINEVENKAQENKIAINTSNQVVNQVENKTPTTPVEEIKEEPKKVELHFMVPVEGEIVKDFSDSSLVYSETLQEWTVHLGIDIVAEKGSAVVASETGTIESIKNDPRYGTTVTIAHENGYKSIYSNLLSAEFVSEGQQIEKGQTIGSVGDNAAFEIADNAHLHFEMKKDGETVNPSNYWEK
jgi:murein DD-endopeptidase MepM/ murein hydrolase activator NlpD